MYLCSLWGSSSAVFIKSKVIFLKATMALLIVGHHMSEISMLNSLNTWGSPIVSVFLFISGFGLVRSFQLKGICYLYNFGRKRIWNIFLPCLVASILYQLLLSETHDNLIVLIKRLTIYGIPPLPFSWYVYCIVILYLLFYIAYKWIPNYGRILFLFVGSAVYVVVAYSLGYEKYWFMTAMAFPVGSFYAQYESVILKLLNSKTRYGIIMLGAIILCTTLISIENTYADFLYFMLVPLIFVLLLSKINLERLNGRCISFISSISYEIYLIQGFPIFFLKRVGIEHDWMYVVLVYLAVIPLAVLLQKITSLIKKL